jgi:hypothetical protein
MNKNPFEADMLGDEFLQAPNTDSLSPDNFSSPQAIIPEYVPQDAEVEIDTAGPFPFPKEAKFQFKIYGRTYTINPRHLLICPTEWLAALDNGVLDRAIEAADSWVAAVYQAYTEAKVRYELAVHRNKKCDADIRKDAQFRAIEEAKKNVVGDKYKPPTVDDIESAKLRLFADDLMKMKTEEVTLEAEMSRLLNLHWTIINRTKQLSEISGRLSREKDRR